MEPLSLSITGAIGATARLVWRSESFQRFLKGAASKVLGRKTAERLLEKAEQAPPPAESAALVIAERSYLDAQAQDDREERALELQRLHLALSHQQQQDSLALGLRQIQADYDVAHWSGLMSRDETVQILANAQRRHHLLLILSEPDVSESCPETFRHDLHREARAEVKQFVEQHYPWDDALCPVEFLGKFFRSSVFNTEVRQLENLLSAVPTVVLYSDLTGEKLYLHLRAWGLPQPVSDTVAWDWEEAREALLAQGLTEKQAEREIRRTIVGLYQWFAALLVDLYFLSVNPLHESRLLGKDGADPVTEPYLASLRDLQRQVREAYERKARGRRQATAAKTPPPKRPSAPPPQPEPTLLDRAKSLLMPQAAEAPQKPAQQQANSAAPRIALPSVENIHGWPAAKVQALQ